MGRRRSTWRGAAAVCVGSLAQRSPASRQTIQRFLDATRPDCLRVFDINLRQSYYDRDVIETTLRKCQVLKLNEDELLALTPMLALPGESEESLHTLLTRYELQMVACTLGSDGSLLCYPAGISHLRGTNVPVVDTVGAGDAFTAALVMGLLRGEEVQQIHRLASDVAAFVCTQAGAMPVLPDTLTHGSCGDRDHLV